MITKVFFIGSCKESPSTGGHIYSQKVVEALRKVGYKMTTISAHQLSELFGPKFLASSFVF